MDQTKSVLNCLEAWERGFTTDEIQWQRALLGAIETEGNAGIFEVFTTLNKIFSECPYDARGIRYSAPEINMSKQVGSTVGVLPAPNDLDWSILHVKTDIPDWIRQCLDEYLSLFKQITNSGTGTNYLKLYTKEQVDEWLNGTNTLDYAGDILFSNMSFPMFQNALKDFASKKYGWEIKQPMVPVFMSVLNITDTSITVIPITTLGGIILKSTFEVAKEDIPSLVLTDKLSIYTTVTNPLSKDLVNGYMEYLNNQQQGENPHA